MIVTQEEAKKMICPVQMAGPNGLRCKGANCMCWEWESQTLRIETVACVTLRQDCPYDEAVNKALAEWTPPVPAGTGWALKEKEYDEEEGLLVASWERDVDPSARGYCGLSRRYPCE